MKARINILLIALLAVSCTKNFNTLNTDPTQASSAQFDANLLLPTAEINYFSATQGYNGAILFESMWAQTFASAAYPSYYSNGDKYVASGNLLDYDQRLWNTGYTSASDCYQIQTLTKGDATKVNLRGIALILELLNIQVITDTYGDVPFSQALQASSGVNLPVYDSQQSIYTSMLAKLDSVLGTLDASQPAPTNDAFSYAGSVTQWKKFGYTLMLRMAMRLTKADATTAQKYAEMAYAGGTLASNADNAYMNFDHADGYSNNNSSAYQVPEDFNEVKWGKVLIDYLKTTADPRLSVIAEVPQAGLKNAANESLAGDNTAANQQGMPNGYDQNGGSTDISTATGYPGSSGTGSDVNPTGKYSRPAIGVYLALNTPGFVLTYAQSELLLAEAGVRGWNVGSASTHYANALAAALQTYGTFNGTTPISAATATAYATANPLSATSATALTQINMQYWILEGTLFDFYETWINWRRSGVPTLTPVNYTGNFSNGTIPRRQEYPTTEAATNPNNYKTAVTNLTGGDVFTSRVWWDK
ncbi:SusD/RagB family nutrient-binding outer membrane lipoprotein [Dinghuibacter silviterrae]|uniref:SusD-like starch-binding protein associating with outer membrane n=1 Tax=Dinghuibacter silviterrae TaxID=1539049 RepID=A0A4R8DGC5_9BACT|nr:SusD/RagB family nutrient-binding outer membrane lipoprotein [Dinghuibacter silviterrae]TDW96683.1 SusD-like starch-binding protein associating with outer membrane [Dinghuibacter silviterrae]